MKKLRWSWALLGLAMAALLTASPAMALTLDSVGVLWTNPQGAAADNGAVSFPSLEIRWGVPAAPSTEPAGLRFDPAFPPSSLPVGTFTLGTLTHFNNQILSYIGGLDSADLWLTPTFSNGQSQTFKYRLLIDETHNDSPGCCPDAISFLGLDVAPLIFTEGDTEYTLSLLLPDGFSSEEFTQTSIPWFAQVDTQTQHEEPPSTVPNPSPLLLIGLGLVGLAGVSRLSAHRK